MAKSLKQLTKAQLIDILQNGVPLGSHLEVILDSSVLFPTPVDTYRPEASRVAGGGVISTYEPYLENINCLFKETFETDVMSVAGARVRSKTAWKVHFPNGTDLRAGDRVVHNLETYGVFATDTGRSNADALVAKLLRIEQEAG